MNLEAEIENAMQVCSNLSRDAREAGELSLMYAANRAWHQLCDARDLRRENASASTEKHA